jgi:hypothetical protein
MYWELGHYNIFTRKYERVEYWRETLGLEGAAMALAMGSTMASCSQRARAGRGLRLVTTISTDRLYATLVAGALAYVAAGSGVALGTSLGNRLYRQAAPKDAAFPYACSRSDRRSRPTAIKDSSSRISSRRSCSIGRARRKPRRKAMRTRSRAISARCATLEQWAVYATDVVAESLPHTEQAPSIPTSCRSASPRQVTSGRRSSLRSPPEEFLMLTGYTANLPTDIALNAGVLFRTISAVSTKLGVTRGAPDFDPGVDISDIQFDGMRCRLKGLSRKTGWKPIIKGTLIELGPTASGKQTLVLEPGSSEATAAA